MRHSSALKVRLEYSEDSPPAATVLNESKEMFTYEPSAANRTAELPLSYRFIKRFADITLSILALVVLFPLMLIIALVIKIDSKGAVLFKQTRVGMNGRKFSMYKFRTMCVDAESRKEGLWKSNEKCNIIFKIEKDPRITRVGKVLRKTSLDELPQLMNILKSEMSIVGPRPPLPAEVEKYNQYQMQRLSVKGGLTCYWQVSGRSRLSFDQWVALDLKYIREMSLWTDFKIILRTFGAVISCDGAL